jgi:hypothetical protein
MPALGVFLLAAAAVLQHGCRSQNVSHEISETSPVLGCWEFVRSGDLPDAGTVGGFLWREEPIEEPPEVDFRQDGRLQYSELSGGRWQIMRLTYRIERDMIVTNQPSSPHEERTRFYFEPEGMLVLEWGGQRHWFRRAKKRAPTL